MRGVVHALWLWSSLCWTCFALAQGEELNFDVLVRVDDPRDRVLLERVRGQTSDLQVSIMPDTGTPIEPTLVEQLDAARRLSEAPGRRVVVWFTHAGEDLTVFVADPKVGRVLVRSVGPSEGRFGGSAQQEAAALVVRSAMRALAAGGEIGVEEGEVSTPALPPAAVKVVQPPAAPEPPTPRWELMLSVGGRYARDGASRFGQYGGLSRLMLRRSRYQGELRLGLGLPSQLNDSVARVALARHSASLHAAYIPLENERFTLSVALGAGANLFLTDVTARDAAFREADASAFLMAASADLTLRFMPAWARERVGIACLLGVDLLPSTLTVGYQAADGAFVERDHTAHVFPTASLELVWLIR